VLPYAEKELGFLFQPPKYLDVLICNGNHMDLTCSTRLDFSNI
jgi:hypothetical protein